MISILRLKEMISGKEYHFNRLCDSNLCFELHETGYAKKRKNGWCNFELSDLSF